MKIIAAFLKYDYGIPSRGVSGEKEVIIPAMRNAGADVIPFWLEENGFVEDRELLQRKLFAFADEVKPDIIFFILMRDEITLETIRLLGTKYKTINWFCDDQWRFKDFTSFVAPVLTYSVTVDKYSLPAYRNIGCHNVILSQWAATYIAQVDAIDKIEYLYDVSFVGGKNLTREWMIKVLAESGLSVKCFGAGWDGGRISFDEMITVFKRTKINLNLSNSTPVDYRFHLYVKQQTLKSFFTIKLKENPYKQLGVKIKQFISLFRKIMDSKNVEQIKARNFEIPGCGGFELSQYALGIEDYYTIGKEIAVFSTIDEMIKSVYYYLDNDDERESIRIAGYKRSVGYTYVNRFKDIFKEISK